MEFFLYIFNIFAQNIDCRYTLEPPRLKLPRRGGCNKYPQSMFWTKNKLNRYTVYPSIPQFCYSPFLHYRLVSSLEIIDIGKTGNPNHPELEVRVVLVACISNIDF